MAMSGPSARNDANAAYSATEADKGFAPPSLEEAGMTQTSFGDYRIIREIGRGGMGVVYEAEQISLGRRVALKILSQSVGDSKRRRRFEREAKAAGRLHHTNIVPVFGVGEYDGTPYYVMQFIEGPGLDDVLHELRKLDCRLPSTSRVDPSHEPSPASTQGDASAAAAAAPGLDRTAADASEFDAPASSEVIDLSIVGIARALRDGPSVPVDADAEAATPLELAGPTSLSDSAHFTRDSLIQDPDASARGGRDDYCKRVARIGVQAASGLDYAHSQGILHRDVKPSNLLLDQQGTVWVTDFGLAKAGDQQDLTQSGDVVGTLRYMAPEAFDGLSGPCCDIYGLGLTLYELLARRPAFDERDRARLIRQVTEIDPPRLRKLDPRIPRDLATIVHKAIERDPSHRYPSAAAFGADLRRFLDDEPIQARRASVPERYLRWARRNPAVAVLGGILTAVLILATLGSLEAARRFRDLATVEHKLADEREADRQAAQQARDEEAEAHRIADVALRKLESTRDELHRTLYATRSNLALSAWEANDYGQFRSLLGLLRPSPGEPDLRGWEWRYLQGLGNQERLTLKAPDAEFVAVAFSSNGRSIASFSLQNRIRFWERDGGRLRKTIEVPGQTSRGELGRGVHTLAYSPDGARLAGPGPNDTLGIYDGETGELVRSIDLDGGAALSLAWSSDGKRLAAASSRHTVQVWNAETGAALDRFPGGHYGPVASIALSPDGRLAATAGFDGVVKLWSFDAPPTLIRDFIGHEGEARTVAFSPDGEQLASGGMDGTIRLWEVASGRSIAVLRGHEAGILSLVYAPSGAWLATGGHDDTIRIWDPASGRELRTFLGHTEAVRSLAVSPDGRDLVSASTDGSIKIWNPDSPPQPRSLYSSSVLKYGGGVGCLAASPDGRRLAAGHDDHALRIWDVESGRLLHLLTGHDERIRAVAFSADGRLVASCSGSTDRPSKDKGVVRIWDAETGQLIRSYSEHAEVVDALVFLNDGHWLASGGGDHKIHIWNAETGERRLVLEGHDDAVRRLALSPDGKVLASASDDGTAKLWSLPDGSLLRSIEGGGGLVGAIAFNHDGRLLATASGDATVQLWNVADGSLRQTLRGHLRAVVCLAFAPDDRLASGGLDKTIIIWDLTSGQSVLALQDHSGPVTALTFTRDGLLLVSSSGDRSVKLWEAAVQVP